ncbi:SDR family oxidoreductase [bacterium]|jgi:NAD(P)-dependent dehydrogenase (short-subunit alcohol dehydrogenase family)|nr:SDR family oxidoreductase [bacterium]
MKSCALITGGSGLLGKEHAYALLDAGTSVILTDIDKKSLRRTSSELSNQFPELVYSYVMDITSENSICDVQKACVDDGLRVEILINNAALNPKVTKNAVQGVRLEDFELDIWNKEINVGLTGAFLCSKIFGKEMAKRKKGIILNIASDLSVIAPDQRIYEDSVKPVTYSVIKTGLVGLTRYLATYWANQGVRVNALSPGGVYNNQSDSFVKKVSNLIPMGRMASFSEYHGAIKFLCSDDSSYMTGQNIVIDGGRSVW